MTRIHLLLGLLLSVVLATQTNAQQTTSGTIRMGDMDRTYRLYVPAGYTGLEPVPLMFNLNGDDSEGILQEVFSEMNLVADTAGFLVVYPDASEGKWSSGFVGAQYIWVDDVGFMEMLIDSIQKDFRVDPSRIYATGFGQGAFMSFRLACELDDRIAGIGAITGNMAVDMESYCTGSRPMPVVHLHGDLDVVNAYIFAGELPVFSLDSVLRFWEDCYHCYNEAQVAMGGAEAGPTWPIPVAPEPALVDRAEPVDQEDIHPSQVIWEFLYDLTHANPKTKSHPRWHDGPQITIYPEPFIDELHIENLPVGAEIQFFNFDWLLTHNHTAERSKVSFTTAEWQEGVYWVRINYAGSSEIRRVLRNGF